MSAAARRHLEGFLGALAANGIPVDLHRRIDFFRAVAVTELPALDALYWVGRVTLLSAPEQIDRYDRLFAAWFHIGGIELESIAEPPPDDASEAERPEAHLATALPPLDLGQGSGREASSDELLGRRRLPAATADDRLVWERTVGAAARSIPRTVGRRRTLHRRQGTIDLRRVLARSLRTGGDIAELHFRRRPRRPRPVLLLVDVSGSLKPHSPAFLRFAHALVRGTEHAEVFTFGTRLTRITPALDRPNVDDALAALAAAVADFDGGTRIGEAFAAFLANGRYLPFARGALILVVSDGLERGDPAPMARAIERLVRLGHRLVWLSPLLGDPAYRPVTRGMRAILGSLDRLGDASSPAALLAELERLPMLEGRSRRQVAARWRDGKESR